MNTAYGWLRRIGAAAVALSLVALAGCSEADAIDSAEQATETLMGHIHDLGTDPETGELYAAAHHGVFTFSTAGTPQRVADRWQDTMAFTVIRPGHLLASGHPDLREDGPVHLGLIESTDGHHSLTRALLTSLDGLTWETVAQPVEATDLAVDPGDSDQVLVTRTDGTVHRHRRNGTNSVLGSAPPLRFLAWADLDTLVGLGPDATVDTSSDHGARWVRTGGVPGDPEAIVADDETRHVATSTGIYRSIDAGATWDLSTAR